MLLPSKHTPPDRALVTIAGQILMQLDRPGTVTATWERFQSWRSEKSYKTSVPFWWFALGLDVLYSVGAVELRSGELRRREDAA
jgi:hypothetical protein